MYLIETNYSDTLAWQKKKRIQFLSYIYHAETDTFTVRPKINWSSHKRGVKKAEDVKNMDQLKEHIKEFPLTKRSMASILMGSINDPLQIMAPYVDNLKLIYRNLLEFC